MILTEQDSYWAADKLVKYFSDFNRIDDYFRSRKIDRIKEMPTPLFGLGPEDDLFQSFAYFIALGCQQAAHLW